MRKKNTFAALSLLLTLGLVLLVSVPEAYKLQSSGLLAILSGFFSVFALREGLSGIEYLTLISLPVLFTFGMSSMLYYFPNFSSFFRFLFLGTYAFFFYVILLSANIFNVAVEKPIPLLRASYTAWFLVTIFAVFPLYTLVYKSDLNLLFSLLLIASITFLLTFQSLWTVFLPKKFEFVTLYGSLLVTLILAEVSLTLSFFPMESFFRALGLSTAYYIVLGFTHHYFRKSLTKRIYLEYFILFALVSLIIILV